MRERVTPSQGLDDVINMHSSGLDKAVCGEKKKKNELTKQPGVSRSNTKANNVKKERLEEMKDEDENEIKKGGRGRRRLI